MLLKCQLINGHKGIWNSYTNEPVWWIRCAFRLSTSVQSALDRALIDYSRKVSWVIKFGTRSNSELNQFGTPARSLPPWSSELDVLQIWSCSEVDHSRYSLNVKIKLWKVKDTEYCSRVNYKVTLGEKRNNCIYDTN